MAEILVYTWVLCGLLAFPLALAVFALWGWRRLRRVSSKQKRGGPAIYDPLEIGATLQEKRKRG